MHVPWLPPLPFIHSSVFLGLRGGNEKGDVKCNGLLGDRQNDQGLSGQRYRRPGVKADDFEGGGGEETCHRRKSIDCCFGGAEASPN